MQSGLWLNGSPDHGPNVHLLSKNKDMEIPKAIGRLWIVQPDICINLTKKPNWFHLFMMRLFFGFVWERV